MSDLMKKVMPKRLFKVVGLALHEEKGIPHLDEGQFYAAVDAEDALHQATTFWTQEMGFTSFTGHAKAMERVGNYKILLVEDEGVA